MKRKDVPTILITVNGGAVEVYGANKLVNVIIADRDNERQDVI